MTPYHLFVIYLIATLLVWLPAFGLSKLFVKAGLPAWKAWIPFYNTWVMQEAAKRPKHWVFWQLIPVVGWFISLGIFVEFVKLFGRYRFLEHAAASLLAPFYFAYLGTSPVRYIGPEGVKNYKKSAAREWIDAGVFAVVAATLIRAFIFESYNIPTPSMEKSLLVNDYLFVSKLSYGPRIPNTPLAMPFVHHSLPFSDTKSYVEWIHIPYIRWFASPVKRNDVVVFNFPDGDTVINKPGYQSEISYYQVCREIPGGREAVFQNPDEYPLVVRPVDKRENFIKRCIGIPGDKIEIKDAIVYVNDQVNAIPPASELPYIVETNGQTFDPDMLKDEYNVKVDDERSGEFSRTDQPNKYLMLLTTVAKDKMLKSGFAKSITPQLNRPGPVFPYDEIHRKWTEDNYGPVIVPKKGMTVTIDSSNYAIYHRAIGTFEHNKLEMRGDKVFINDKETNTYTFKMDYFWMMGDNRHNSADSRYWGFVPEDHVVGKASLIFMSWDGGPRWNRIFKGIK
jgi:signal peptidase I